MSKTTVLMIVFLCFCFSCCYAGELYPPRQPGGVTGTELYQAFKAIERLSQNRTTDELPIVSWAVGYETGIAESLNNLGLVKIPPESTTLQRVKIVIKYIDDHPEKMNLYGWLLYLTAMSEAFNK